MSDHGKNRLTSSRLLGGKAVGGALAVCPVGVPILCGGLSAGGPLSVGVAREASGGAYVKIINSCPTSTQELHTAAVGDASRGRTAGATDDPLGPGLLFFGCFCLNEDDVVVGWAGLDCSGCSWFRMAEVEGSPSSLFLGLAGSCSPPFVPPEPFETS